MPKEFSITEGKKTSVLVPPDLITYLEDSPLNQSLTIVAALRFFFTEKEKITEYQEKIVEYEKRESESQKKIAVLEARVSELNFLKEEFARLHKLLDDNTEITKARMVEMQQKESRILLLEDNISKKEEKILLLEDAKKSAWWMIWKKR
jgi:predicted RNase H-like nuclease (RuvC/YqgF family)